MRIRCAWCANMIGEKPPLEDLRVTDGICPDCLRHLTEQADATPTPLPLAADAAGAVLAAGVLGAELRRAG